MKQKKKIEQQNCDPRFAREVPDRDSIDNKLGNSEKKGCTNI